MKLKNNSISSLKITPDIIDYYLTVLKGHNPSLKPIFRQNGSVRICVINYRKISLDVFLSYYFWHLILMLTLALFSWLVPLFLVIDQMVSTKFSAENKENYVKKWIYLNNQEKKFQVANEVKYFKNQDEGMELTLTFCQLAKFETMGKRFKSWRGSGWQLITPMIKHEYGVRWGSETWEITSWQDKEQAKCE